MPLATAHTPLATARMGQQMQMQMQMPGLSMA